jgi:hypothetical protein
MSDNNSSARGTSHGTATAATTTAPPCRAGDMHTTCLQMPCLNCDVSCRAIQDAMNRVRADWQVARMQ